MKFYKDDNGIYWLDYTSVLAGTFTLKIKNNLISIIPHGKDSTCFEAQYDKPSTYFTNGNGTPYNTVDDFKSAVGSFFVEASGDGGTVTSAEWEDIVGKPAYLTRINTDSIFNLKGDGTTVGDIRASVVNDAINYDELTASGWETATLKDINIEGHGSLDTRLTALENAREFKGAINAGASLAQLDDAISGYWWLVNIAGTFGGIAMGVNDMVICHTDVVGTPTDLTNFAHIPSSVDEMIGCTDTTDGVGGTIPAPLTGDQAKVLYGDKTWGKPVANIEEDGSDLKVTATNLLIPAPSSTIDDVKFDNSEMSMWLNESENKFNIKAKKSDGSFVNQTIGEGSGGAASSEYAYLRLESNYIVPNAGVSIPFLPTATKSVVNNMTINPTNGYIRLIGGKTYRLFSSIGIWSSGSNAMKFSWRTATGVLLGNVGFSATPGYTLNELSEQCTCEVIYTPTSDIDVYMYVTEVIHDSTGQVLDDGAYICVEKIADPSMIDDFLGSTEFVTGNNGLVPSPHSADRDKFLKGSGEWANPTDTIKLDDFKTTDVTTGTNYKIIVDNGVLYLEEV